MNPAWFHRVPEIKVFALGDEISRGRLKACRDTARLAILGVRPHDLFDFPAALLVRLN
jgi:hypothetical protein